MIINRMYRRTLCVGALLAPALFAESVQACAVCFGDPNSGLVKGAKAGMIVLGVIVYFVLFTFAGVAGFWALKAKRLAAQQRDSKP